MRRIAILDAPSNLGLRPPTVTSVPGCAKAPGALRDHGLLPRLQARDAGCLTPPRYDPGDWRPGDGVCHASEIAAYSKRLADRIGGIIDAGEFPVVLGGDCSIVLGSALAMNRLGEAVGGRIGLVFVDGHSDFRHPGNASYVGAAAGEDLALVTGRGQADLAAMERRRPYYRDIDVVVLGIRAQDEYRLDLQAAGIVTRPVPTLRVEGAARSAQWAREQLMDCAGYWVHLDVDVLDPAVMPAVDAPSPGGIAFPELEILLAGLVDTPHCLGVEITVFDPDYDPDGAYAAEITSALVAGLAPVRTVAPRPDLVAARRAATSDDAADAMRDRDSERERDAVRERRAAAAQDSVPLAAAGMSGGGSLPGTPVEAAAPAVTMLGVRDGEAAAAGPDDRSGTEPAETAEDPVDLAAPVVNADADEPEPTMDAPDADPAPAAEDDEPIAAAEDDELIAAAEDDEPVAQDVELTAVAEDDEPARASLVQRPLGSAPLLDSDPLPATRPGMLRPRPQPEPVDGFSLPVQRPAFDIGPEEPADIS